MVKYNFYVIKNIYISIMVLEKCLLLETFLSTEWDHMLTLNIYLKNRFLCRKNIDVFKYAESKKKMFRENKILDESFL